jgi:hypothetical protein
MATKHLAQTWTFYATTSQFTTGDKIDAAPPPTYRIYEEANGTPILTGDMVALDDANTMGLYCGQVEVTQGNGFENGKDYCVYIQGTVDGVAAHSVQRITVQQWPGVDEETVHGVAFLRKIFTNMSQVAKGTAGRWKVWDDGYTDKTSDAGLILNKPVSADDISTFQNPSEADWTGGA